MCREIQNQFKCGCIINKKPILCNDSIDGAVCDLVMTEKNSYDLKCNRCRQKAIGMWNTPPVSPIKRKASATAQVQARAQAAIDLTADVAPSSAPARKMHLDDPTKKAKNLGNVQPSSAKPEPKQQNTPAAELAEARARRKARHEQKRESIKNAELRRERQIVKDLVYWSVANCTARAIEEAAAAAAAPAAAHAQEQLDEELEAGVLAAFAEEGENEEGEEELSDEYYDSLFDEPDAGAAPAQAAGNASSLSNAPRELHVYRGKLEHLVPCHGLYYKVHPKMPSVGYGTMCGSCCQKVRVVDGVAELVNCFEMFDRGYWSEEE